MTESDKFDDLNELCGFTYLNDITEQVLRTTSTFYSLTLYIYFYRHGACHTYMSTCHHGRTQGPATLGACPGSFVSRC
jgi:hypothetical protein